jgi:hypothetical protein
LTVFSVGPNPDPRRKLVWPGAPDWFIILLHSADRGMPAKIKKQQESTGNVIED